MAADSRSTHTDALATLGTIIGADEKRDAIHLGVEPAIAGRNLVRGAHVGFGPDGRVYVESKIVKAVGIVDPFLNEIVLENQRFWLVVYPRQITSLRHVWEHPDFKASGETDSTPVTEANTTEPSEEQLHQMNLLIQKPEAVAKEAIRNIAKQLNVEYDELMEHAHSHVITGEFWVEGGRFEGVPLDNSFWSHYRVLNPTQDTSNMSGSFLSCSC